MATYASETWNLSAVITTWLNVFQQAQEAQAQEQNVFKNLLHSELGSGMSIRCWFEHLKTQNVLNYTL